MRYGSLSHNYLNHAYAAIALVPACLPGGPTESRLKCIAGNAYVPLPVLQTPNI